MCYCLNIALPRVVTSAHLCNAPHQSAHAFDTCNMSALERCSRIALRTAQLSSAREHKCMPRVHPGRQGLPQVNAVRAPLRTQRVHRGMACAL